MINLRIVEELLKSIPFGRNHIKKIFILRQDCPHCNEYADSSQFKDFVKSNDFTYISFDGFTYCGDCKDTYIINRLALVETPILVDVHNLEVVKPPEKYIEWLFHYRDVGIDIPKNVKKRTRTSSRKTRKRKEPEEINEFVRKKIEAGRVRKATDMCLEDTCIE